MKEEPKHKRQKIAFVPITQAQFWSLINGAAVPCVPCDGSTTGLRCCRRHLMHWMLPHPRTRQPPRSPPPPPPLEQPRHSPGSPRRLRATKRRSTLPPPPCAHGTLSLGSALAVLPFASEHPSRRCESPARQSPAARCRQARQTGR